MQYLLSRGCRPVLVNLAQAMTLCAFDFDGTLAPIVARPEQAAMGARTHKLLVSLAALYPSVIVSGRARRDLLGKLNGVRVARVIGNHGAETESVPCGSLRQVRRWKAVLDPALESLAGVWVEDKGLSLAVHYRQAVHKSTARRKIIEAAQGLKYSVLVGGKQVVNVIAQQARNKGDALAAERTRLGCQWVLYVGDDENDEDAFAMGGNIVAVRIGRKQQTHACYYLRYQTEIDDLLELLVRLRKPVTA